MIANGFWKPQPGLPFFVPIANRLSMAAMTFIGGWIILRASRHITSIRLLKQDGVVKMLLTVRRTVPLPFVKPRKIVIDPFDFVIPSRMVEQLKTPVWAETQHDGTGNSPTKTVRSGFSFSRWAWNVFAGFRKVFTHEGFLDVTLNGRDGKWKLDTAGEFANGGQYLLDIVSRDI